MRATTGCPTVSGTLTNGAATLEGSATAPGSATGGTGTDTGTGATNPDPFADCVNPASTQCLRPIPVTVTVTAPVTLADIAAFRPIPPVDHMQPGGWTIAGLDTNFYATGGTHIRYGQLLGRPASVRFTPVGWHWSYGDGSYASRTQPGSTWAAQSIAEFDPTPTSHVYADYGTYLIDLDVDFTADYRYDGGSWVPIHGTLTAPANRLTITVGSAKTVLVDHDCTSNPSGPGC